MKMMQVLKFVIIVVSTKLKNILQKYFGGKEYMYDFFVQTVVIKDSDDSEYDDETYVPDGLEKDEEEEEVVSLKTGQPKYSSAER